MDKPLKPITFEEFRKLIPSSASKQPKPQPVVRLYSISIQVRDRTNRWKEFYRWEVLTDELNMGSMLNFGLRDIHRVVVSEISDDTPESDGNVS